MNKIIPSVIAKSQEELDYILNRVKPHVNEVQLDVFDGKTCPNLTFDWDFKLQEGLLYELDLYVENPIQWLKKNGKKVDKILTHVETIKKIPDYLEFVKSMRKKVGFCINPKTSIDIIKPYLNDVDQIVVMTVIPGFYGSSFIPDVLNKVIELRKLAPKLDIEVDGGITDKTLPLALKAGANLFISGSYLLKADDLKINLDILNKIIGV